MKNIILILALFLSSCYVYEGAYTDVNYNSPETEQDYWSVTYAPTVGIYYYNGLPYWGYYEGHYYYYGYVHYYPWWYYYNIVPSRTYHTHTHVYCNLGNRNYVKRPNRNRRFDNKNHRTYNINKPNTNGFVVVTNHNNVPTEWRTKHVNLPKTKIHVNKPNTRTNSNTRVIVTPNRNTKVNTNHTRPNTIKIKTNRSNKPTNKTFNNRSNKTNNRTNTKKPR